MKLITKNTDYAIQALMELCQNAGKFVPTNVISNRRNIPYQYLRKILQQLLKVGFIESQGGGAGGFRMKMSPGKTKLLDVMRNFQGDIQLVECTFRHKACRMRKSCVLRKKIKEVESLVVQRFEKITLKTLVKEL